MRTHAIIELSSPSHRTPPTVTPSHASPHLVAAAVTALTAIKLRLQIGSICAQRHRHAWPRIIPTWRARSTPRFRHSVICKATTRHTKKIRVGSGQDPAPAICRSVGQHQFNHPSLMHNPCLLPQVQHPCSVAVQLHFNSLLTSPINTTSSSPISPTTQLDSSNISLPPASNASFPNAPRARTDFQQIPDRSLIDLHRRPSHCRD